MTKFAMMLLMVAGFLVCFYVLPKSWTPWSLFGWFAVFLAIERFIVRSGITFGTGGDGGDGDGGGDGGGGGGGD
jgi:uncharacterized membrane protein YgcG